MKKLNVNVKYRFFWVLVLIVLAIIFLFSCSSQEGVGGEKIVSIGLTETETEIETEIETETKVKLETKIETTTTTTTTDLSAHTSTSTSTNTAQNRYLVYRDGYQLSVDENTASIISEFSKTYRFEDKLIYACIINESAFQNSCISDGGKSFGLAQIQKYWISTAAPIDRFTDDYYNRDLLKPYDNLLTLMEIWTYARNTYGLDTDTYQGQYQLLYWHNTGQDPRNVTNFGYCNKVMGYKDELILIQK